MVRMSDDECRMLNVNYNGEDLRIMVLYSRQWMLQCIYCTPLI